MAMFKLVIPAAVCLTVACASHAADRWVEVPTAAYTLNNKQDALSFAGEKAGWYGNGTGAVYGTTDGGDTWKRIWSNRGTYVRAIAFVDDKTGFLGNVGPGYFPNVADKRPLYATTDGGKNWTPVRPRSGRQITGVCAIDVLRVGDRVAAIRAGGRVGGPAGMLESFDGGRTFTGRDMSSFTGMILDIRFIDEQVGFIAGASEAAEDKAHARILKTTDGGKTWRTVSTLR